MKRKAVVLVKGKKYFICCDVKLVPIFIKYVMEDDRHREEIKTIYTCIIEGLTSKKFTREPFNTRAMKPFLNNENDRILCNVTKRKEKPQCIVMSEIYLHKSSEGVDKKLKTRYEIISKYQYEIIE